MRNNLISIFCLLSLAAGTLAQKQDSHRANSMAVVAAERAFAQAAATKGTRDAFLEFLADEGIIFQPGPINGKEFWRARQPRKGLLSWYPIFAESSASGDLGYTTGPYEFRPNGADDKPVAFGHYFTIWKKQADGSWKAVLDRGISTPQPSAKTDQLQLAKNDGRVDSKHKTDMVAMRASLLKLENEFSQMSGSQGADKAFAVYLADDVRLMRDGSFPSVGKRFALGTVAARKGMLIWQPMKADVSESGDLGYIYGTYELKSTDGKIEKGNYVRVWKKQTRTAWKVVVDILNPVPST